MSFKPIASLSSGLLVRKGDAAPTPGVLPMMPPQNSHGGHAPRGAAPAERTPAAKKPAAKSLSSLGAERSARAAPPASPAEVVLPSRPPQEGKRIAMTVRLDRERYIRLKTVGIHSRQSCQKLLTDALDHYLEDYYSDHDEAPATRNSAG